MISVIVPVYYGEKYIAGIIRQIEAGKEQLKDKQEIELLFVNDSPDAPLSLQWKSEILDVIIINSDRNAGIHGARVKGLLECHGEYVMFLDQDDRIEPAYFDSQLRAMGNGDAVICKAIDGGKEVYRDDTIFRQIVSKEFVLKMWNMIISPGQVLMRRDSIPDMWTGNIMQRNGADDWFLWICMMAENCKFSLNTDLLYEHVLQDSNTSEDIVGMVQSEQEVLRIVGEKGILSHDDRGLLRDGFFRKNLRRTKELCNKKKKLELLERWIGLKERGLHISNYFLQRGVQTIAIYGCGIIGEFVNQELKKELNVKYFIDRNADRMQKQIPIYTLQDSLPEVDGIMITLVEGVEKAEEEIRNKMRTQIFILKDCVIDLERKIYSV